jgi:hypothetical protein
MPIERVKVGEAFQGLRADDWNQIADTVDGAQKYDRQGTSVDYLGTVFSDGPFGVNAVIQVTEPVPKSTTANNFRVKQDNYGITPVQDTDQLNSIVVTTGSAQAAGFGSRTLPDGISRVLVNIVDDLHEYAWPLAASNEKLQSGGMGYRIIWKESVGTGDKWCLVRMSHFGFTSFWGVLDQDVAADATGTVTVTAGSTIPAASVYPVANGIWGEDIGAGTIVVCRHYEPSKAQIVNASCEFVESYSEEAGSGTLDVNTFILI